MIYKNKSSQSIIRKVFRDLKPTNDNWTDDAVEWIGEALEHIGASPQLVTKNTILTVTDYKVAMPADLYYVNQVSINVGISSNTTTELDSVLAKIKVPLDLDIFCPSTVRNPCINTPLGCLKSDFKSIAGKKSA